ncbi:hypothetical protein N0V90_000375 [Kalmusia sp. IMI 367209]|nr:hypothetical protein N0V90_000375 [Kalmusia sp. IMI 367209]
MSEKPLSILISGGGVAGASLALMLARQPGFKTQPIITLIERSPVPRTTGQAIDIRGPAVDVIRDAKAQSATSEYEILRGELAGMLLDGVNEAREKGVQANVVYGETIRAMDDRDDGSGVDVTFTNGKLPNQKFDVVVAADGISSTSRSLIFGKEDKREHVQPSGLYLGFFSIPRIPEDDETWRWANFAPGLAIHLRPHRNQKTMGVYLSICNAKKERNPELESIVHADVAAQKTYLRQRFRNSQWQTERFLDGLDASEDFYMSHWCQVRTPQWAKGRCVTLGDAAFATMGIGTSFAMIGAYCIAGELSKIASSKEVPQALQSYERIFRPFVAKHEMTLPGFPQLANPQTVWGTWIMHTIMKTVVLLRIPQMMMWAFGGEGKESWKLPEYGW